MTMSASMNVYPAAKSLQALIVRSAKQHPRDEIQHPRGSKYPIFKAAGPKTIPLMAAGDQRPWGI